MKTPLQLLPLLNGPLAAAAAALALSASASAASLLIDFQAHATTDLQSGAQVFAVAGGSSAVAANGSTFRNYSLGLETITVTLFARSDGTMGGTSRTQTNADFTAFDHRPLYRDFVQGMVNSSTATSFSISGLDDSLEYTVKLWAYEANFNNGATFSFYNVTSGSSLIGSSYTNTTTAEGATFPDNNAFSVSGTFTPNIAGELLFAMNTTDGLAKISGMEITAIPGAVIPEPSGVLVLGGLMGLGLLIRRREGR